ncbi:MAG: SCO family protein [Gammaproteobacteria bacterium]
MRSAWATAVVFFLGCGLLWLATDGGRAFTSEQARRLQVERGPLTLPVVALEDQSGHGLRFTDYAGQIVLVDFIYTRCPALCTVLGSRFQQLQRALTNNGKAGKVALLSVSFDPDHDNPAALTGYAGRYGADGRRWRIARIGDSHALTRILKTFGVVVIPDGFGGFQHNAAIHVLDRQGRLARILDYDAPDAELAEALAGL